MSRPRLVGDRLFIWAAALIGVGIAPLLISLASLPLASLADCQAVGGAYVDCWLFGRDLGVLLNWMALAHWLTIFTLPLALAGIALAAFVALLLALAVLRRHRRRG